MSYPGIDNYTIVKKSYGRIGVALHPFGGLTLDEGLSIEPFVKTGFVSGDPEITVNNIDIGERQWAGIETDYRREGQLVTVYFVWIRQGNYAIDDNATPATGTIRLSLPFEADTNVKASANIDLLDYSILEYGRFVSCETSLNVVFVDSSYALVSDTSPFSFFNQDAIYGMFQYIAANDTYLWEN